MSLNGCGNWPLTPPIQTWLHRFSVAWDALRVPARGAWRIELIRSALDIGDAEIRDAAVQASETWSSDAVRRVLEAHEEMLPWLRDYIRDVVEDLEE